MALRVKHLPAMQETWVRSLGQEDSLGEGDGNPLQYSCLEKSHGWRSLVGYSPWGHKELDMTSLSLSLSSLLGPSWAFPGGSVVKNISAMQKTQEIRV